MRSRNLYFKVILSKNFKLADAVFQAQSRLVTEIRQVFSNVDTEFIPWHKHHPGNLYQLVSI